jgi:hypothetical protein
MSKKSWTEDKLPESDELTLTIARHLEIDNQYVEFIGPVTSTASPRCGRQDGSSAGRSWPTQTSPNDEGRVTDIVAVREWPNEEKEQRTAERAKLLMGEFWSQMFPRKKRSDSPEWRVRQT